MEKRVAVANGAEAFLELLAANGVEYIFLNPGTDTFPLQDAISKFQASGKTVPAVVLCLDESLALAAAHGHFLVSHKPQVVIVHADLGPQQLGGALHNAQRGRIGVILCSGRVPANLETSRRNIVHWLQEQFDQSGVLRGYVKWDYELRSCENIHHVVQRAYQVAASEPSGPVYLSLPQDPLTQPMEKVIIPEPARYAPPRTPQADAAVLEAAASVLAKAENPLIICGYSGRNPQSMNALVALAETIGARVVDSPVQINYPTENALYSGFDPNPLVFEADVILAIDSDVPYIPAQARPKAGATIIHIDIDALKENFPLWGFPVDYLIQADSAKAIPILQEMVAGKMSARLQAKARTRSKKVGAEHREMKARSRDLALARKNDAPISPDWLSYCLDQALGQDDLVMAEVVTNRQALLRQLRRTTPASYFQSGGSSLGWGLGAALGAKLAAPQKTVAALVGDGSFNFGCPTAALWAANAYHAPFLTVIFNNQRYNAPSLSLSRAGTKGNAQKPPELVGINIQPSPDYAALAEACFARGKKVEDPAKLLPALKEALREVRSGRCAIVDVRIATGP
jgi:acetolactate synthase-1/2/3 large subunit